jgi:S-DNA-T family DNA segregation ATPase FtsK/SpoIIIE
MGRKKKKQKSNLDLQVAILFIASIVLAILIYGKPGYIGQNVMPQLENAIGWIQYFVPIAIFAIAVHLACEEDKRTLGIKIIQYLVLTIAITIIITVFNGDTGTIGRSITASLVNLVGRASSVILSLGVIIILSIFMYGIKPAEIVKEIVEERKETISNRPPREPREKIIEPKPAKRKKRSSIDIDIGEDEEEELQEPKISGLKERFKERQLTKKELKELERQEAEKLDNEINIKMPEEDGELFKKAEEEKEDKTKQVLTLEHTLTVEDQNYEFPPISFLNEGQVTAKNSKKAIADTASKLQRTLHSFGVAAKVENVSVGPTITRYELKPAEGVRVSKIANLSDDIALNLAAETIRIEAPIPGKQAVGIEIPNKEKNMVSLREIIEDEKFQSAKSKLAFAVGKDAAGETIVTDIAKMPHVLIAGSTGSGKSVCINTLITSIIYKAKPSEVKLVMVDPKVVELSVYNGIPHLLIPVVTDPRKAAGALAWAVQEMVNRYHLFAEKNVRDISGYNDALEKEGVEEKLPQIVIIIDELADLMMVAAKDVEDAICRLAQMARAAGMHLVIATQRPSVDVITGVIKANIASRIAFAVTSGVDSRTILDSIGAEKLLGKGDMLFYPSGAMKPQRVQGAFISDSEVEKIVTFLKDNGGPTYSEDVLEKIEKANSSDMEMDKDNDDDTDELLMEAIQMCVDMGQASASALQRRFKIGYTRAGRIIDQMEERGIISGYEGSKPRKVLVTKERWEELKMAKPPQGQAETAEE